MVLGVLAVAGAIGFWAWRAFSDSFTYDFKLAYFDGGITWTLGRPESWFTWTGTPLLAAVMAVTNRLWDETTASRLLTGLNILLVVGVIVVVVRRLRSVLSPLWLWIVAVAIATFGPVMSTVWWKQFNIFVLVLALGGFAALRRDRMLLAGALIGFSVGFKPLVFLLPLVLLARRSTRLAGIWGIVFAVGLNIGAEGLYAIHAHSVGAFDLVAPIRNFLEKSRPGKTIDWACAADNYSPQSLLCRTFGSHHWTLENLVVYVVLIGVAVWVVRSLRGHDTSSWECFAFVCVFSTAASAIDWSHYQVVLAPLFVLLIVRFTSVRTHALYWVGLVVAYVLSSLSWSPYGMITDVIQHHDLVERLNPQPFVDTIAEFAPYVLVVTGVLWYRRHGHAVRGETDLNQVSMPRGSPRTFEPT